MYCSRHNQTSPFQAAPVQSKSSQPVRGEQWKEGRRLKTDTERGLNRARRDLRLIPLFQPAQGQKRDRKSSSATDFDHPIKREWKEKRFTPDSNYRFGFLEIFRWLLIKKYLENDGITNNNLRILLLSLLSVKGQYLEGDDW